MTIHTTAAVLRTSDGKRFVILPNFWEPGGEELTLIMKMKRKPVIAKYATQIDSVYASELLPGVLKPAAAVAVV